MYTKSIYLHGPDSPDKYNFNKWKKHDRTSESIKFTMLFQKRINNENKNIFAHPVELAILFITY